GGPRGGGPAAGGPAGREPALRGPRRRLAVPGHVAQPHPPLVRHADLRQPGQGPPPPRAEQGGRGVVLPPPSAGEGRGGRNASHSYASGRSISYPHPSPPREDA